MMVTQLNSKLIDEKHYKEFMKERFLGWIHESRIVLDGRPFTFRGHEYLIDIYRDKSQHKVFKKAAQMGFSTMEILSAIHGCKFIYKSGVLYLLATRVDVTDFSKGRFSKIASENSILNSYIKDTDTANLKRIGNSFLYFRGAQRKSGLKTIPVDKLIVDEFDEHDPVMVDLAEERLSHSQFKHTDYLSTPTIPDYGIDVKWQASDQKHWVIKCGCGKDACFEDTFPECLQRGKDGVVRKVCIYCGRQLHSYDGRWEQRRASDISGYYISQLNSIYVSPAEFLHAYETDVLRLHPPKSGKYNPAEFWNSKMGIAWVDATDRLEKQQIYNCCDEQLEPLSSDPGPCTMGVDQGAGLHVVVCKDMGKPSIIHLDEYLNWGELDDVITNFGVQCCLVDAMPETRDARAFQSRFRGKVWLVYYTDQKGALRTDESDMIVQVNRTESMDESHNQILNKFISIHRRTADVEEFASHCRNTAKKLQEDDSGSKRYVYLKLGPDHYRHAFNYECLARTIMSPVGAGDSIIAGGRESAQADWDDNPVLEGEELPDYY